MMRLFFLFLVFVVPLAYAQKEPSGSDAVPEPPDIPLPVESGESLEPEAPEITIKRRGDQLIHEYRINGVLYMVKIVPDLGPAYYMVDSDGDGNLDVRHSGLEKELKVPQWVLLRW